MDMVMVVAVEKVAEGGEMEAAVVMMAKSCRSLSPSEGGGGEMEEEVERWRRQRWWWPDLVGLSLSLSLSSFLFFYFYRIIILKRNSTQNYIRLN